MKKFFFVALFILMLPLSVFAADDTAEQKRELIDRMLEQTGQSAIQVGKQFSNAFLNQISTVLRRSQPDIDPRAFEILEEEVKIAIDQELILNGAFMEMMYPIYSKHFTVSELEQMIALNDTELGQKMIRVMPLVTQEGMQAGQQFGQSLGPKIQERLLARFKEEGISLE